MSSAFPKTIDSDVLRPQLPELGQIKIGGKGETRKKRGGGGEYQLPVKYDHFKVTGRARGEDGNLIVDRAIHATIGEKPTELDVRLLWDEPEANFQYFLAAYDGKRARCRGNGVTAQDREKGEIPCTCPLLKAHVGDYDGPARPVGKVTCKPHGRLSVMLDAAGVFGGFHVFRTTSWESIRSIAASLSTFRAQFGFLAWLPLRLVMYPSTDTYEDGGQTKTSTSYKVALVLRGTTEDAFALAEQAHAMRVHLQLPSGAAAVQEHMRQMEASEEEEAAHISEEWHPEVHLELVDFEEADTTAEEDATKEAELQALEDTLRLTLEAMDWDQERTNRQIAKYSHDLTQLEAILEERAPTTLKHARAEISAQRAPVDPVPADAPPTVDAEVLPDAEAEPPESGEQGDLW